MLSLLASIAFQVCVVVDPGHGGSNDAGATFEAVKEKDLTLQLARRVQEQLAARSVAVVLTRDGEQTLSLQDRARVAAESHCALLVSVHFNASTDARLSGIETYYLDTMKDRLPARLADIARAQQKTAPERTEVIVRDLRAREQTLASGELAVRLLRATVEKARTVAPDVRTGGARRDLFELLMSVPMPAVIVEGGYVSNPGDRLHLQDARYQTALAQGIADGVSAFLSAHPPP